MVFNKKKGAMMKRNANEVSSKVIKKNKKVEEDDEFEGSSLVVQQSKHRGSSTIKTSKSLQNTAQSGKKNLKQNTPMPTNKEQLGTPNTVFPVSFKKQAFVPKNQSLVFSGKKNQQSAKQANLKQFPGMNSSQNKKGKSDSEISAVDSDNEEDDEEEEDEEEEEDDEEEEEEDDDEEEEEEDEGDDDEEDDDDGGDNDMDDDGDEEGDKKAVKQKIGNLKRKMQIMPESEKKGKQSGLQIENDSTNNRPSALPEDLLEKQKERKLKRDVRFLYIKGFSNDMRPKDIKALSPDILDVSFPNSQRQGVMNYAFLEFENEEKAEENYKKLQDKNFVGNEIIVDFRGSKSKKTRDINPTGLNSSILVCEGIPVDCTVADIAALFPKAFSLNVNSSSSHRTASAKFRSDEDAAEAFKANGKAKIRGKSVTVSFPIKRDTFQQNNKRSRPFPDQRGGKRFRK